MLRDGNSTLKALQLPILNFTFQKINWVNVRLQLLSSNRTLVEFQVAIFVNTVFLGNADTTGDEDGLAHYAKRYRVNEVGTWVRFQVPHQVFKKFRVLFN